MSPTTKRISFINNKGGTGKTTSCLSIAGYLAKWGSRVLVVDLDPQANATSGLGIDGMTLNYTLYDAILDQCNGYIGVPITHVILETCIGNLHLVPAELDLAVGQVLMQHSESRAGMLRQILKSIEEYYDYILIDTPPSSGLLMINSLYASDHVVVPLDPCVFSLEALDHLDLFFRDVGRVYGHSIDNSWAILIRYVRPKPFSRILRKHHPSKEIEARLRKLFSTVFVVPESLEIYPSQREGLPISHYAPTSKAGRAYESIAEGISNYIEQDRNHGNS